MDLEILCDEANETRERYNCKKRADINLAKLQIVIWTKYG
jgi:hypothetical protein